MQQSFLEELERTVALLAFEDVSNCPVGELLDISQRLKTASEVNAAILTSQSHEKGWSLLSTKALHIALWSEFLCHVNYVILLLTCYSVILMFFVAHASGHVPIHVCTNGCNGLLCLMLFLKPNEVKKNASYCCSSLLVADYAGILDYYEFGQQINFIEHVISQLPPLSQFIWSKTFLINICWSKLYCSFNAVENPEGKYMLYMSSQL